MAEDTNTLNYQINRVVGGHNEALKEVIRQFGVSVPASTKADDLVDKAAALGSKYSFSNFLTSPTAALFGLSASATPEDVLNWIGQYNTHWWSVLHGRASIAYDEKRTNITKNIYFWATNTYGWPAASNTITYSSAVTVDQASGAISLKNPTTVTPTNSISGMQSMCRTLLGKYLLLADGKIYYVPSNATYGNSSSYTLSYSYDSEDGGLMELCAESSQVAVKPQIVTSQIRNIPAGATTYVHSTNRNAYPEGEDASGNVYEYLGVPFTKATTAPRIAVGTYVGTGQNGASEPTTLTLDFTPKMVIIQGPKPKFYSPGNSNTSLGWVLLLNGIASAYVGTYTDTFKVTWGTNTVSWYSSSTSGSELNAQGMVYHYFAIG